MDGAEALALAYGWAPADCREEDLADWAQWVGRALRLLKARGARR